MKRLLQALLSVLLLSASIIPVYAYEWPPPVYDMPRVAYDGSAFGVMVDSLKITLGAITNTGFRIAGAMGSVILIAVFFYNLFLGNLRMNEGVFRRMWGRRVKALDRARNLDSIVDERVADMEVNLLAKNRFRLRHPHADLDERIYQREVSYQAEMAFNERHPDWAMNAAVGRRERSVLAQQEYRRQHPWDDFNEAMYRRDLSQAVTEERRIRDPDHDVEEVLYRREVSREATKRERGED